MFNKGSGLAALVRVLFLVIVILTLAGCWPGPTDGPMVLGVPVFIPAMLLGTLLMVLVPYVKEGLQRVAETGRWVDFPPFDWRYAALFLLPILAATIGFLTVEGLWGVAHQWGFVQTVSMSYMGVDLTKQMGKMALALRAATEGSQAKQLR